MMRLDTAAAFAALCALGSAACSDPPSSYSVDSALNEKKDSVGGKEAYATQGKDGCSDPNEPYGQCKSIDLGPCGDPYIKDLAQKACFSVGLEFSGVEKTAKGDACSAVCCDGTGVHPDPGTKPDPKPYPDPNPYPDPKPYPDPEPHPEPDASVCFAEVVGDGLSCIPYDVLKRKAAAVCSTTGGVAEIYTTDDCVGGASIAKVLCCEEGSEPKAPPPDPGTPGSKR